MQYKPAILFLFLCFLLHRNVCAQSVLYSSTVSNNINTKFEVIGKAGNFYWSYKNKTIDGSGWPRKQERSFEVYDARLERVKQIPTALSDSVVKQYLVPQKYSFDQLIFKNGFNKTSVVVNRFTQDGDEVAVNAHLFDFPGQMALEDLLVARSPDRTKILILGFLRTSQVTPDIYVRMYTRDWLLLHDTVYKEGNLLQPYIQYELTEHVMESSDASPIKVTNNGDWLMVAPARFRNSFILCHFKNEDGSFFQMDVAQSKDRGIEYCNLSVEADRAAYIGILENLTASDKRVRVMRYSLSQGKLSHDTSYSFYVQSGFKRQEKYLFEEAFIQVPGRGFMYMKEYGKRYFIAYTGEEVMLDNEQTYAAYSNHPAKLKFNKDEYINNTELPESNKKFERGDLSVKYFPFHPEDTSWSGLLHVEQTTELSYADLSYACVPSGDKIIFLYNSLAKNENKVGNTMVLDHKGQPVDEGFIFWRATHVLDFQKARLIVPGELFVPYERRGLQGFAIIRLRTSS